MHQRICFVMLIVSIVLRVPAAAATADDRGFDPSGVWMGQHGPLALMRTTAGLLERDALECHEE